MAFQLKARESARDGIRRTVRHELEAALAETKNRGSKPAAAKDAVHEIRKGLKRVRAALRLVRDGLGDEPYHAENVALRDAAQPLALVRDAEMLPEAWAALCAKTDGAIEPAVSVKVRDALLANEQEVARRILAEDGALATAGAAIAQALARVGDWKVDQDALTSLERGLRRVYRMGRRAGALAGDTRTVEDLHEWRKQAKYLWHSLELLTPAWTGREKSLDERFHRLSRLLGDDHDLAVLRRTLAADPLPYGGHRALKSLFVVVDRRRVELEQEAFALGDQLYAEPPDAWTRRILGLGPAVVEDANR